MHFYVVLIRHFLAKSSVRARRPSEQKPHETKIGIFTAKNDTENLRYKLFFSLSTFGRLVIPETIYLDLRIKYCGQVL